MPLASRGRVRMGSGRIVASQHVDDGPDQLRDGPLVVVGLGVVELFHHPVLVVERDLAAQEDIGRRLGRCRPGFPFKRHRIVCKSIECCLAFCRALFRRVVGSLKPRNLGDDLSVLQVLRRERQAYRWGS